MKKLFAALLIGFSLVVMTPVTTFATPFLTTITGVVSDGNGPVNDAKVDVVCHSTPMPTSINTGYTNAGGVYTVNVLANFCPAGNAIVANASKDNKLGTSSAAGSPTTHIDINLGGSAVALPEMSTIAMAGATAVSAIAFMIIRRKYVGHVG